MLQPNIEGVIQRRILINYRADLKVVAKLVPAPLRVVEQNGAAIVGICLIRLSELRPKRMPACTGLASENMAHRVAVRYPVGAGWKDGVFIWRRESDSRLISLLGGRLFPGVHERARFDIEENLPDLRMRVTTRAHEADVSFRASCTNDWQASPAFKTLDAASDFFRCGDSGFSCAQGGRRLEGMRLHALEWRILPLEIAELKSAFFAPPRFPPGSLEFDSAFLMRNIRHEWHSLASVPELAGTMGSDLID